MHARDLLPDTPFACGHSRFAMPAADALPGWQQACATRRVTCAVRRCAQPGAHFLDDAA
jgi:hypothetical protein